jgi:hypothetical protein
LILASVFARHRMCSAAGEVNKHTAESMLLIASILRLGEAPSLPVPLDEDSRDRLLLCLRVLAARDPAMTQVRGAYTGCR